MKYTEKYHLPQWVKEDRIMMDDFNQMCADIEAGLEKNVSGAAADNAAAAEAARKAQETADQALRAAAAAQNTADQAYSPGQKPYVIGSYTGTGMAQNVTLGFRPSFLIISSPVENAHLYTLVVGPNGDGTHLQITSTGFVANVNSYAMGGVENPPFIVGRDKVYNYIAFR